MPQSKERFAKPNEADVNIDLICGGVANMD